MFFRDGIRHLQSEYCSESRPAKCYSSMGKSRPLPDADIKEGDIIFTSGKSGLFPEDVMIGTVIGIFDDSNGKLFFGSVC